MRRLMRRENEQIPVTPREALIRGGHKNPDQILDDLAREGFIVAPLAHSESFVDMWISRGGTVKKLINGEWSTEEIENT